MTRICFVSYEIFPTTRGGCGVLLHNAASVLLSQGHEVVFVLDVPYNDFQRFQQHDRLALPNSDRCRAYHVDTLCKCREQQRDDFLTEFHWRAFRFHQSCEQVVAVEQPDVIEFFDYCGPGHYALSAKAAGTAYQHQHLAVRVHTTMEVIDAYAPGKPLELERYHMFALEHSALQLAETILYPSKSYLEHDYVPRYQPWFGNPVFSKPPLIDIPRKSGSCADPQIVLCYGRLSTYKGVDRFVDAAIALLSSDVEPRLQFLLAGFDSNEAPDGSATYQEYLRKKIPLQHQHRFLFPGQLNRDQLERLLPSILYAVFPNYIESFGYAAHEIYAAGVPIIVSNIPSYADYFQPEVNALVFDGSVGDLARQMRRLYADVELRSRITCPFAVNDSSLGDFYARPGWPTWIAQQLEPQRPSLLVCLIADDESGNETTLAALDRANIEQMRVVILRPASVELGGGVATWLLVGLYTLQERDGRTIMPTDLQLAEALLIVRAGDRPTPTYVPRCLDTLMRQPQIAFVGSWKHIGEDAQPQLQTFPLDTALELVPFCELAPLSRVVIRTTPGHLLIDLFDSQVGALGELAYLWQLESGQQRGILIPEPLIAQRAEPTVSFSPSTLTYLVLRYGSPARKMRLGHYLLSVNGDDTAAMLPHIRQRAALLESQLRKIHRSRSWKLVLLARQARAKIRSLRIYRQLLRQKAQLAARRLWPSRHHSER